MKNYVSYKGANGVYVECLNKGTGEHFPRLVQGSEKSNPVDLVCKLSKHVSNETAIVNNMQFKLDKDSLKKMDEYIEKEEIGEVPRVEFSSTKDVNSLAGFAALFV